MPRRTLEPLDAAPQQIHPGLGVAGFDQRPAAICRSHRKETGKALLGGKRDQLIRPQAHGAWILEYEMQSAGDAQRERETNFRAPAEVKLVFGGSRAAGN